MSGSFAGKRILIAEDEYFIAAELKQAFQREDAIVVGPVANLDEALTLATAGSLSAGVLDVNLNGHQCYALALRLQEEGVPYIFLTGYDGWALPAEHRAAPRIAKPFTITDVLGTVRAMVER